MRHVSLAMLLSTVTLPVWAEDIPVDSSVSAVTLYPQGATITREVEYTAPAGRHDLIITDLPASTPLESVRVSVEGAEMGGVTARNDFVPPRDDKESEALKAARDKVEKLEQALRDAEAQVNDIRLEAEAAQERAGFLKQLGKGDGIAQMDPEDIRGLSRMVGEEILAARRAAFEATRRADAADRDLKDQREELEKARQAERALVPEQKERAMLAVAIDSAAETSGRLTVTYNINAAGWQPVYDLKLTRESGELAIERGAFIHQETGENWQGVALEMSTVRPSEQTAPGEVWPWLRRVFEPPKNPPQPRLLGAEQEAYAADMAAAPMMRKQAAALTDGLSVRYAYPEPVDVASGADRLRLTLGTLDAKAEIEARAVPLLDQSAFLMAHFKNTSEELILPTAEANFYLDGRFVGARQLELIPAGDEADLSFGPIEGLRLTREVLEREEGDKGLISKSMRENETVRIKVENLTGESWPVRLLDHVPYSEQEELKIDWSASPEPSEQDVDAKRGVLAWEFMLEAGQVQDVNLTYELNWPEGKILQ